MEIAKIWWISVICQSYFTANDFYCTVDKERVSIYSSRFWGVLYRRTKPCKPLAHQIAKWDHSKCMELGIYVCQKLTFWKSRTVISIIKMILSGSITHTVNTLCLYHMKRLTLCVCNSWYSSIIHLQKTKVKGLRSHVQKKSLCGQKSFNPGKNGWHKCCTVKNIWLWKNFGEFGDYSISPSFVTNFYNFHNIPYANGLQFAKGFSAKLPTCTVLICQPFLPSKLFTVQ